ncbi:hypothetical protein BGZ50_002777, partial [Haplosporangium sp. Z 11]
ATERYTETLNSALSYFSSLAQSSSGWKRLSSTSVRPQRNTSSGSPNSSRGGGSSALSSPSSSRHSRHDDLMAHLPGGPTPSSAASAAIESLLPSITVSKKSVPGKSAEIVRASIVLPGLNEQTDLEDWRAVLECTGARKIWDQMVESSTVLMTLDDSTCITKTVFKTTWPASPRDALLIETTLLDHNAVLHIATSIKPSHDDPIFLRPSPPHVRAYLPLVAWHIQLVPADVEDTVSFTSFNSLAASQNKPVMPRHSIRVSFYYQIDMRGWAVNSSVSMQSHVPSCIANVYRLLRRQGVPPHVSRHSPRIQLDLNEYDPATGVYELRYDVIPPDSDDLLTERRTVSSALKQFRLGSSALEEELEIGKDSQEQSDMPQEIVLSDDEDELGELDNENLSDASQNGYVDVELDGEKWGVGSDIVVHIFMNDIEDEEFVQENVECLKYMGRDRYILRMKHTEIGSHHGAINVKLRIERIPQQTIGGANLLSHQQLRFQRQQQEQQQQKQQQEQHQGQEALQELDMNGLIVSVNGHEKNILPFHRSSIQSTKRISMSLQDQLELSQQIVQEVNDGPSHYQSGSDGVDGQENRSMTSPLLLMSSSISMTTAIHSLNRSSQSIMSNGTSTMGPSNTNPSKVNSSYAYFNSLLHEPPASWKSVSTQRGVQISKLDVQGHAPGIVKGEGVFDDFTIWDIKAVLDCASARKIWDKMFDESHMLQQATPSSILNYVRLKGFWPTSPKDMAVLNTTFVTKDAIHYFATSVDDTQQFPTIPPPVSPFVRSEVVVSGWYLESIKPKSVRVVYIAQAAPTGWVVPGTALGAMTTEMPLCVAEIIKYLEAYGSPPTLVSIRRGRALGIDYLHEKSSFRLEYVQDSNPVFSGHRALLQQQQQQQALAADRHRRSTVDCTVGVGAAEGQQYSSPKLGPTDKLLAEIRLDARIWARNGDCEITIDPPPSKVTCTCVPHDGTGYRLRIEHSSGRAVPAGGKVLLMARKPVKSGCGIVVNGVAIKMPSMEHLEQWTVQKAPTLDKEKDKEKEKEKDKEQEKHKLTLSLVDGALAGNENQDEDEDVGPETNANGQETGSPTAGEDNLLPSSESNGKGSDEKRAPATLHSPLQYAQGAMDLLTRIRDDAEDSWAVVSDSKGMRVTKRFMPTEISNQVPLVRGEKVIEGFSLEEIATVIGTLGTRSKLDDLFESGEMLQSLGAGCSIFHHVLKSYFPLPLPARDLYFITVTASAEASVRCPQIVILSTSVPPEFVSASNTLSSSLAHARPRAHLHLSAWILERIDPYSSSHPIPSTRVTYMTALDLGGSVPQRVSALIQTTFPKMILQVESYLQFHAAPPIVRIPVQMVTGASSESLSADERRQDHAFVLPSLLPWIKPANRLISWDFKAKDSFCEILLVFDQFQLTPSRLDIAAEKRTGRRKKACRDSNEDAASVDMDQCSREDAQGQGLKTMEKTKSRTVLELIVDLKQYPMGYNIITNIKVDPEFLLQQKQQRDSGLKNFVINSVSNHRLAGSVSSNNLPISNATSNTSSKIIGGFSNGGHALDNNSRASMDVEGGHHLAVAAESSALEAASSGTGIAAVLGSSANVPRSLPSSTSLIRILPPPITVHIVDIPPAPSHSSSLSGVSKRRKHLIVVTVPEAESSQSHVQQQSLSTSFGLKGGAPHIVSGTKAKPVVTASSVSGTTSMMFATDDRVESKHGHQQSTSTSSQDTASLIETIRPTFSPEKAASADAGSKSTPSTTNDLAPETRMFQFDVKIDRLEHKDLDHSAQRTSEEDHQSQTGEKEWSGKVMVDGLPAKIVAGWSRQELGFLDDMLEDDETGTENQKGRKSSSNHHSSDYSETNSVSRDRHSEGEDGTLDQDHVEDENRLPRSVSRRRKHHRQQLANLEEQQILSRAISNSQSSGAEHVASPQSAEATTMTNPRPIGAISGLSNFLMNVGLLSTSSQRESRADFAGGPVDSVGRYNQRSSLTSHGDLGGDSTIRANKSVGRTRIGRILNSKNKANGGGRRNGDHDHDLDLESLHGPIVFNDQDTGTDNDYEEGDTRYDRMKSAKETSEWTRVSGTVRRRKDKSDMASSGDNSRLSFDETQGSGRSEEGSETDSESRSTQTKHRRRDSRFSAQQRSRSTHLSSHRYGSTNGADHPRFRGSRLYAYSFRNLLWSAVACFLFGLLLRIFVIGPSFLKAVSPALGPNTGTATYYYYYHVAPKRTRGSPSSTSTSFRTLSPLGRVDDKKYESGRHQGQSQAKNEGEYGGDDDVDSSVWPQGIQEVFTVRRVLGWDYVLLAYPSQDE